MTDISSSAIREILVSGLALMRERFEKANAPTEDLAEYLALIDASIAYHEAVPDDDPRLVRIAEMCTTRDEFLEIVERIPDEAMIPAKSAAREYGVMLDWLVEHSESA